jgi:ribokinase
MSIVVIGSINTDLTIKVPHFARCNETVLGTGDFTITQGGKGANQAVAAAAGGLPVHMVGKVGSDAFGDAAIADLRSAGVMCDHVARMADHSTGLAAILLDPDSNNSITVAPGANASLTAKDVRAAKAIIAKADILMLQLEIPLEAVNEAIALANEYGTQVMLDPAPATAAMPDLHGVDYLTPNEVEAESLSGISPIAQDGPHKIAEALRSRGVRHVALTLGVNGCYIAADSEERHIDAIKVNAVDTTGAGDTFNGFLATALARGLEFARAAEIACAAASISVTRAGARSDLPSWEDTQEFLLSQAGLSSDGE